MVKVFEVWPDSGSRKNLNGALGTLIFPRGTVQDFVGQVNCVGSQCHGLSNLPSITGSEHHSWSSLLEVSNAFFRHSILEMGFARYAQSRRSRQSAHCWRNSV
jgi:hypothetical protein